MQKQQNFIYIMKSSSQKKRTVIKSQSYQQFNIEQILTSQRNPQRSIIYDKSTPHIYQHSLGKKNNKFLIQLPKIYPIHKKLLNLKSRDIDLLKFNDRRFQLRGFKYSSDMDQTDDTTIETEQLKKSQFSIQKKQSMQGFNSIFSQLILRLNNVSYFVPIRNIKLKAYVEEGNNSRLIKELLRKRCQLKLVQSKGQADIVWTRFSDYTVLEKFSKYTEKLQKHSTITSRSDDDFMQGFRKMSQLQPQTITKTITKSIEMISFFMHNHLKNHQEISDKKNLFKNIRAYCKTHNIDESSIIPKTYHIDSNKLKQGEREIKIDQIFSDKKFNQSSFFIVKPGEDTNRGEGISVVRGRESMIEAVKDLEKRGKSSLIQQYINPLLYRNRKFDIRCYVLVTSIAGQLHAYWYKQGYLRTCCKEFSYDPSNIYGHLTNDAVQKKHKDYGKFEQANKLSFNDLQVILGQTERSKDSVIREMKTLAKHSIKAVQTKLRGEKNIIGFEIFGYDFLIDTDGKVWLIEVNTNPCLEFAGSLLSRIIWHMVDNSLRIAVDPYLDVDVKKQYHNYFQLNKYECII